VVKHVVFLCPHNALRSVIAASLFNQLAQGQATAESAGTDPAERVTERTIQVLREVGIEVPVIKPQAVSRRMLERADRVITLTCPLDPELAAVIADKSEEWPMPDTAGKPVDVLREVRELIKVQVERLLAELEVAPA
jgi:arsenate reductase (thioredoxin)